MKRQNIDRHTWAKGEISGQKAGHQDSGTKKNTKQYIQTLPHTHTHTTFHQSSSQTFTIPLVKRQNSLCKETLYETRALHSHFPINVDASENEMVFIQHCDFVISQCHVKMFLPHTLYSPGFHFVPGKCLLE